MRTGRSFQRAIPIACTQLAARRVPCLWYNNDAQPQLRQQPRLHRAGSCREWAYDRTQSLPHWQARRTVFMIQFIDIDFICRVIYGADLPGHHHEIINMDEAREALVRIKAEGGPSSFSYKNYQLPSRAARQRLLLTARNMSMICVPEGGMNLPWDLTYIQDGMTTVEHNLPMPIMHDDILTFFALSGTGATPTHIVNYGGPMGQELLWLSSDLVNDEKLRRFLPHDGLQGLQEVPSRPTNSYAVYNTSISTAKFVRKGGLANLGAHGQPPVGLMYHAEASFFAAGGMTPYEVSLARVRQCESISCHSMRLPRSFALRRVTARYPLAFLTRSAHSASASLQTLWYTTRTPTSWRTSRRRPTSNMLLAADACGRLVRWRSTGQTKARWRLCHRSTLTEVVMACVEIASGS